MTAPEHQCVPITNDKGEVIARARESADIGEDGMRALASLVTADQWYMADPDVAAERARRQEAVRARIAERLRRIRGEGG